MPAATRRQPTVAELDESAAEPARVGGSDISEFIDEPSLQAQTEKFSKRNREETKPFRQYQKKVLDGAGVANTHQHRQIASDVCGSVARLSALPDKEITLRDGYGEQVTEWELQVRSIATSACANLPGDQVFIVTAMKLARAALDLRAQDPDGKKGIAWVNDTRADEAGVLDE